MFLPTAKAVFEGNVHGVVVQAKKYTSPYLLNTLSVVIALNCATAEVSFTFL